MGVRSPDDEPFAGGLVGGDEDVPGGIRQLDDVADAADGFEDDAGGVVDWGLTSKCGPDSPLLAWAQIPQRPPTGAEAGRSATDLGSVARA